MQLIVASDKAVKKTRKTGAENAVDAIALQPLVDLDRQPGAGRLTAQQTEDFHHLVGARQQRARHVAAQDEEFGDPARIDDAGIHLPIRLEGAERTQQRPQR